MAQNESALAFLDDVQNLNLFDALGNAIQKPNTKTLNTTANGYNLQPGTIGAAISAELNNAPKDIIHKLSEQFPVNGMQPELKAQMNLAATLSDQVAADAKFYKDKANKIAGNMAKVHVDQTEHKSNMFQHDLTLKKADVDYMGAVGAWQTQTMSLMHKARERHAGIQLAQSCL